MESHQRVFLFSSSHAFVSWTDLGILTPNFCVQTQYFDFSFPMMQLCFSSTCCIRHANSGLPEIRRCTVYSNICTGYEFFIYLRVILMLCYNTSIGRGIHPPFLSLCNTLLRYALRWIRPAPLLPYRRTYGWQSPGIWNSNFPLHSLDMIISSITMGIMVFVLC